MNLLKRVRIRSRLLSRAIWPAAIAMLPLVLLFSSVRIFRELDQQRNIYLRHRVALLAARLETLPTLGTADALFEELSQDEPQLVDVRIIERGAAADTPDLETIWSGRELFRTESVPVPGGSLFRTVVPFHSAAGLRLARIDLNSAAADFLILHARHNVVISVVGGVVLVLLSLSSLWAVRRISRLEMRQLETEHLAHLGQMSAMLAHEIRNPLGTMKGFVQLAGERADPAVRDLLQPVVKETLRLETLVNDLLAYGRPPAPENRLVGWNDIASHVEAHARHMIGNRPIHLIVSRAYLKWETDPSLLGQALLNLVRNAVEAVPPLESGEISIRAEISPSAEMVISVLDNGSGLTEQARERLFEPFFTTKAFGTGLGLAITRKLAKSLGGDLQLRSRSGGGTEAEIRFPKVNMQSSAMA